MLEEHDRIVLTRDLPAQDLEAGDVGTIVHASAKPSRWIDGNTVAIATVPRSTAHGYGHHTCEGVGEG